MPRKTSKAGAHFDALFGARQGEQLATGLKLIPRGQIERGSQPRQSFPTEELSELAASLAELRRRGEGIEGTGFLQPLVVTQQGDGYRLVAGERRYRASEMAGIELLPAIVVVLSEGSVLIAQLIENLQRRDLPPLEEAQGMRQLMSAQGLSMREAAHALGKGRGYVENRLNLLRMGADVQAMVSVQTDTLLHAREIDGVSDPNLRRELIRAVLQDGLSRAELRQRIKPQPQVLADEAGGAQGVAKRASGGAAPKAAPLLEEAPHAVQPGDQDARATGRHTAQALPPSTPAPSDAPPQSVLSQLRPAVALTTQASETLQQNPFLPCSELNEIRKHLRVLEEQIQRIKAQLP